MHTFSTETKPNENVGFLLQKNSNDLFIIVVQIRTNSGIKTGDLWRNFFFTLTSLKISSRFPTRSECSNVCCVPCIEHCTMKGRNRRSNKNSRISQCGLRCQHKTFLWMLKSQKKEDCEDNGRHCVAKRWRDFVMVDRNNAIAGDLKTPSSVKSRELNSSRLCHKN